MLFQLAGNLFKFRIQNGHFVLQHTHWVSDANTRHHIFPLGVDEEIPFNLFVACRGVAGHGHPRGGVVAHVAKDHCLDVHGRAQIMGDAGRVAVINGPFAVPRLKHSFGGQPQLLIRVGGEIHVGVGAENLLKAFRDQLPIVSRKLRIALHTCPFAFGGNDRLKYFVGHVHHHTAKHLHQAAIEVVHEAGIPCQGNHPFHHLIVQADVENGVHHAGHGEFGPRAARNQQRIAWVAKLFACRFLHRLHSFEFVFPHASGEFFARLEVGVASGRGHGESGRHGHAKAGHVGQIGSLAAQQGADFVPTTA